MDTHGSVGRLLLWDEGKEWWLTNDAYHEVTLICSQLSRFNAEFEAWSDRPFEWVQEAYWGDTNMREVEALAQRYALKWNP
jgi:hypothetical protein